MLAPDRHLQLRLRTLSAHRAAEAAVGPLETLEDYRRYLRGIDAFRSPIEAQLQLGAWPQAFGAWRPVRIGEALAEDLADLRVQPAPRGNSPNLSNDIAGLMGQLYVLEGSALGARLLYANALRLGLRGSFGARHLAQQSSSLENWRRFLQLLKQVDLPDFIPVVRSALATFYSVERAFKGVGDGGR